MKIRADFNGLFGDLLCLSHEDTCVTADGRKFVLQPGMLLTAFDGDMDERENRDDLIATGTVQPAPGWLRCSGSKWVLRIDANGVRHESGIKKDSDADTLRS